MNNRQTDQTITALYERLSRDDELMGDSNSIIGQKQMLEDYAAQHGFTNCVHYTDDGYSGGTFERPSWKRLLADIDAGKVGAVLAKDMSRIGRDYLQTGFYTEVLFRERGVRFIAVANGVDSADKTSGEFTPFLNIMNEWYLRDCSRKQVAAYQIRGRAGKPNTANALYGYRKDPEDKHHWLVDEEAAAVVRRIFRLSIEGRGPGEIARILRDDKVERPSYYLARHGSGTHQKNVDAARPYDWANNTVAEIIAKPEYMGHTVNFRSYKESYKDKHARKRPPEEWMVFEDTHEAIVDPETWKLAQQIRRTVKRTDNVDAANPLTGLVYCAECGGKMYNHRSRSRADRERRGLDPVTGLYPYDHYDCSTYSRTITHTERKCTSHYITTRALRALVLDAIREASAYALSDREAFTRQVREASEIRQREAARDLKRQVSQDKRRCAELDGLIKKLYEAYATGKMPEKRYEMLSADYEREQAELEASIEETEKKLAVYDSDTDRAEQFLALVRKYTDFTELTTPMIYEFVDKIVVHAPDRSTGERVQEVDIYLKFIGKFDVPRPEPTAEELEKLEKDRQRRAYNREKSRRCALRKKQRQEAAAV